MSVDHMSSISIIVGNLLLGVWLSGVFAALEELSWGSIRKLDPQKKNKLIHRAGIWLEQRRDYQVLIRLLLLLDLAVMAVVCNRLLASLLEREITWTSLFLCTLVSVGFFALITEALSGWLATNTWPVLNISMPILRLFYYLCYVLIRPAILIHRKLETIQENEDEEEKTTTEDEIEALLDHDAHVRDKEVEDNGSLEESTGKMIRGVLDLDETLVKEIMTPRVDIIAVPLTTPIDKVKKTIIESGHSRIPVYRDDIDDIVGIVYSKNMLDDGAIKGETPLEGLMHTPIYIPETKNVDDMLQELKQSKVHIAVVIDEYGGTAGLVTLEDILEEIVGEIADEFDQEEEEPILQVGADGSLELEARTPIDDVNEALELNLPEEEDNVTIGGYVTSQLGRIPKNGEHLTLENLEIKILKADKRKIDRLIIRQRDDAAPDNHTD